MFLCEDKLHSARCCKTLSWLLYLVVNDFGLPLLVFERRALPEVDFLIFRGEFGHHLCVHGGDLWKQMEIRAVLRDTQLFHLHLLLQLCPSIAPQTDHRLRDNGVCPHLTHPITLFVHLAFYQAHMTYIILYKLTVLQVAAFTFSFGGIFTQD